MRELAGLFGWITVWGFCFEVLNYFIKFINKKYISKLPKEKKKLVDLYRTVMKFIIKFHKPVGIITVAAAITHLILMAVFVRISISGIIGVSLMLSLLALGLYGVFINKNRNGKWFKLHRAIAFVLIVIIIIHVAG
ncbi:hypothetical protein [Aminipila terrae]|uniref:Uncharacterized protein n=1 Tax=Aminipila terrae TaxID=2697030 RepID=A0A6P1MK57_9FIRM|nr:hypothetical protein [Aminipila terrae]QHI73523.1 hypothetical protein Ami3637_15075 [Aminipila terrae]